MNRILEIYTSWFAGVVLAVICVIGTSSSAHAGNGNYKVEGTLVSLEITAPNTANATIKIKSGATVTVHIVSSTKVERNDQRVKLTAFKVGDRAQAIIDPVSKVASKFEAVGP